MCHPENSVIFSILVLAAVVFAGCQQPPGPYVPKSAIAPEVVYCNDNTGHKSENKPWAMGGNCCCTPSDELMAQLHRDGFCEGMTVEDLAGLYQKAGISLRGPDHRWCNGLCPAGPHVVLSGKCMCPPTPGTAYCEKIVAGTGAVARMPAPTKP
jgi:hypothetical protein